MDMISARERLAASTSAPCGHEVARRSVATYRGALIAATVVAATIAWLVSQAPSTAVGADPELTRLLRMMALLKAALAVGAAALVGWRLGLPAGPRLAAGYIAAAALLAAGPALMWGMTHVVAGGLVFHAGLVMLIGLGWRDGMGDARSGLAVAIRDRAAGRLHPRP